MMPGGWPTPSPPQSAAKVVRQAGLLTETDPLKRLEMVMAFMEGELGVLQVERKIRGRVKRQMEKTQREYYLNEQLKAIQSELGGGGEGEGNEIAELQRRSKDQAVEGSQGQGQAELKKLRSMQPMSAEATVIRNYLDVLLGLPWGKKSKLKKDIAKAQAVLDADHYALDKVKDRIVEYLAVQARTNKLKGPILCLVGPPGVGKTSLGKSIAKATGREFVRQSLGGVRDEAEIRGHRRTYIGSMPGKIVTNLRKAGTSNPLFLLDEIDKLGQDFRGDPASALLEVLDPEQNAKFQDHYLELDYRPVGHHVRVHREQPQPAAAAARPDGDHPARRLYRGREGRDRRAPPDRQAGRGARPEEGRVHADRGGPARPDPLLHPRGRACARWSARSRGWRARACARSSKARTDSVTITPENLGDFAGVRKFKHGVSEEEPRSAR
jgi:ATP-dependent Lon protease